MVTLRTTRRRMREGVSIPVAPEWVGDVAMMRALVSTSVRFRLIVLGIAGVLLLRLPESWCFALNALSFGAIIIALIAMRLPDPVPARKEGQKGIALGETIRYLKTHPAARYLLPTVTAVAVFALPGAYTPTCSAKHVPGYVQEAEALKKAGVDEIWCISVNDAFVMGAWGKEQKAGDKVMMLADGSGEFSNAMGLTMDLTKNGMGVRSQRYAMIVQDGVIKDLFVEKPGAFGVSSAENVLKHL